MAASQSTRLHCAEGLGCITEADYVRAREVLGTTNSSIYALLARRSDRCLQLSFRQQSSSASKTAATKTEKHAFARSWATTNAKSRRGAKRHGSLISRWKITGLASAPMASPLVTVRYLRTHIAGSAGAGNRVCASSSHQDYFKRYDSVATQAAIAAALRCVGGMAREIVATPLHPAGGG